RRPDRRDWHDQACRLPGRGDGPARPPGPDLVAHGADPRDRGPQGGRARVRREAPAAIQGEVAMVATLTPEQTSIRQMIAEFAKKELAERAFKPETEQEYRARLRKLAQQGLLGLTAPVEYGGAGLAYFDALLAVEEMAKYDPRSASEM